jgi:hypothetical protein
MESASAVYEAAIVQRAADHTRLLPTLDDDLRPDRNVVQDLVVRRISDGEVIVSTPADLGSPEDMLKTVEQDLHSMTAEEFFEEWKMPSI